MRDVRVMGWPDTHEGQHFAEEMRKATCLHCGREVKLAVTLRRSSSRTGQYGMGFTRSTALKGLRRAARSNHLRHCIGRLPGDWPEQRASAARARAME